MVQKENESKLISGKKKLDNQKKKEEEQKDMMKMIEHKFGEFEEKVKKTINDLKESES